MQISFTVNGQVQLDRNLRLLVTNMPQLGDFFNAALNVVELRTDEIFNSGGSMVEKAPQWAALSPRTLKARDRRWGYYKRTPNRPTMMRWTGNMQDRKSKRISDRQASISWTATSDKGKPYPVFHQEGGRHLPRRVIVDLGQQTNEAIVKELQGHVQRVLGIFGRQI